MPRGKGTVLPKGYRLRRVGLPDLPILVEHRARMWMDIEKTAPRSRARGARFYHGWLRTRLADGSIIGFLVEETDKHPIASGLFMFREWDPPPGGGKRIVPHIISMFTDRAHRGKGIVTAIVNTLLEWSREHGYAGVTLSAAPRARRLYARLGFTRSWGMGHTLRKL